MLSVVLLEAGPVIGVEEPDGFVEDILPYFLKYQTAVLKKTFVVSFNFFFWFSTITSESSRFV
jgi:hypothetical protein